MLEVLSMMITMKLCRDSKIESVQYESLKGDLTTHKVDIINEDERTRIRGQLTSPPRWEGKAKRAYCGYLVYDSEYC